MLLTSIFYFFFLSIQRQPRSTLFPYTTLFRSIMNRINEITFNSSLIGEYRAIDFVARLIDQGKLPRGIGLGEYRSEEHTSELQSRRDLVCRLLLEKKNMKTNII